METIVRGLIQKYVDTLNKHSNRILMDDTLHAHCYILNEYEPPHDKTNKMECAPSEGSDQPGHLPSLISLRCPYEESLGLLSYPLKAQIRRLWSDWAHSHFVGFVTTWLIYRWKYI